MGRKKKPKFKIGDIVVITIYGTVGTITNIHRMNEDYLYEVNHSDILYFENTLTPLSEFEGNVYESEIIEIQYDFGIGDIVQVNGYGQDLFKVIGIRTELWRYKEDAWEEVRYELVRVRDGEWMEASEEEITMILSQHDAEKFFYHIHMTHLLSEQTADTAVIAQLPIPEQPNEKPPSLNQRQLIDSLLDIYNDYKLLYQWFGNAEYKEIMEFIIEHLKKYSN
ncbi:hypothetical protein [Bacillus sp. FJAT-47783]|uniref:hypothetical protein n=1 Tax=Bacillus sp. FJAT-47783 TaxID=2922712 RepID=UPI001FADE9FD|nr:hypothetical protein [Bacillus sp. FJAT-47783]